MITFEQFLVRQPSFPEEQPTDKYYWEICGKLLKIWNDSGILPDIHEAVKERMVLTLIGYYQDVIVDAGIWHAFINENRRLYNRTLPFFPDSEDYVDYELNLVDIRFILWYALAMYDHDFRIMDPLDGDLASLAKVFYDYLESIYDDSPLPVGYRMIAELEMHAKEDEEQILTLGNWLSFHCYLMVPAFSPVIARVVQNLGNDANNTQKLQQAMSEAVAANPTGPLALFIREWLYLIIEDRMPPKPRNTDKEKDDKTHPYYEAFMKNNDGKEIAFLKSYDELNAFLKRVLGWDPDKDHLENLRNDNDFVLLVNKKRGMLLARNIARNIAAPENPLYDKSFAEKNAIRMLTKQGYCPCDLTMYACRHGWLPDAKFKNQSEPDTVGDNYDFIARCFLQLYYRD